MLRALCGLLSGSCVVCADIERKRKKRFQKVRKKLSEIQAKQICGLVSLRRIIHQNGKKQTKKGRLQQLESKRKGEKTMNKTARQKSLAMQTKCKQLFLDDDWRIKSARQKLER